MVQPDYTIPGERTEADQLARQAGMAEATFAFLARVRLRSGWDCLDVGCGTGQVTTVLADAAGPAGRVVGIDADGGAPDIARQAAQTAGVDATFVRADATAPFEHHAYARLLLSHLVHPLAALRSMRATVRPGGVVAVEDLFTGTLHADPPVRALDRLQQRLQRHVRYHGGDPTIGPRLPALLAAADLDGVHEDTVDNPMTTVHEKLFLVELVDNMRHAMRTATGGYGLRCRRPALCAGGCRTRPRDGLPPGPHSSGVRLPPTLKRSTRSPHRPLTRLRQARRDHPGTP